MKLFEPQVLIIILVIVLIIFGPKQLPQLGKSLGKTMKSIRDGVEGKDEELSEGEKSEAKPEAKKAEAAAKDDDES
jgi:sec-independent protein translocase protein TatA